MNAIPSFEKIAIVGDNARLIAEISSLFTRPRHYMPVISGPHLGRPDWSNEVIRRSRAISMAQSRRVLLADMTVEQNRSISHCTSERVFIPVKSRGEAQEALKGWTKTRKQIMAWGRDNLGVGLLLARRSKSSLVTSADESPQINFVANGNHLLIVCEGGEELAEIIASNLAFATGASFLLIPELPDNEKLEWLEELYALESGGSVSYRFSIIRDRVRNRLPFFDFSQYKQALFVTKGFPWGIAVPERPTTHMLAFPDFGRCVVEGLWAAAHPENGVRTALLIQPDEILGNEMEVVGDCLKSNISLVREQLGDHATAQNVRMLLETVPFDIIMVSSHAGDVPGQRITYKFTDSEGIARCLVTDEVVNGFEYDSGSGKVRLQTFSRFHKLDGIDWTDSNAKSKLYVGTAITSWEAMGIIERCKYRVASENIPRVIGSMGLRMHDNVWIPALHAFPFGCTPIVFNNACSSWHRLSAMFMFAGARAYIGTLFPVMDFEAQEIAKSFFVTSKDMSFSKALWASQNQIYQAQDRRPYVMVGLPFHSIQRNTIKSVGYLLNYYASAISDLNRLAEMTPYRELREEYLRCKDFLVKDSQMFESWARRSAGREEDPDRRMD